MMQFKKAVRENIGLLIGLISGTGGGKTFSGMRLAAGIANDKRFALIDTENGRGKHYADQFDFDHADLRAPFEPRAYAEAIAAADKAGYPVIVVDSMSHEWAGDGGVLDMQEEEFHRLGSKDSVKMLSWAKPKGDHKKMVTRLLQVRAHLILCFRAEEKIEMRKDGNGRMVVEKKQSLTGLDGWCPICEKNLPYELTASFLFTADKPGIPKPIKLQQQHRSLFPLDQPITEDCGRGIALWAAGGSVAKPVGGAAVPPSASPASPAKALAARWGKRNKMKAGEAKEAYRDRFCAWATVTSGITVTDPASMDEEAIDRCNISLDEVEAAA